MISITERNVIFNYLNETLLFLKFRLLFFFLLMEKSKGDTDALEQKNFYRREQIVSAALDSVGSEILFSLLNE